MDNQRMQEIHEMSDKLKSMGFTEENIKALYEIRRAPSIHHLEKG